MIFLFYMLQSLPLCYGMTKQTRLIVFCSRNHRQIGKNLSRFLLSTRIILNLDILLPFIIHISRMKWIMCCGDLSNHVGYAKDRKSFINVFKYSWDKGWSEMAIRIFSRYWLKKIVILIIRPQKSFSFILLLRRRM